MIEKSESGDRMLTIIFVMAVIWVIWKMLAFGLKAAWGIAKIAATVILLPLFIAGLACIGLIYIALPILVVAGLIALIGGAIEA